MPENKIQKFNQPTTLAIAAIALLFLAAALFIAFTVGRTAYLNARLRHICPDYFSVHYAHVVDDSGMGLDSVAVTMRDNSNFNVIYRTFTDHSGRFELFNDFGSFALHNLPFSYEIHVAGEGQSDTVRYKFQRHRLCHFRKIEGPDTIVFKSAAKNRFFVKLDQPTAFAIDELCGDMPWQVAQMSDILPEQVKQRLTGWKVVFYGTITLGRESFALAIMKERIPEQSSAKLPQSSLQTWYVLDRNRNSFLHDEPPVPWRLADLSDDEADCTVRDCAVSDTLMIGSVPVVLQMNVRDLHRKEPVLRYRRHDAVKGTLSIDGRSYAAILWDRSFSRFTSLQQTMIGIDLDRSGSVRCDEGSPELFETAVFPIAIDSRKLLIDTIQTEPLRIAFRKAQSYARRSDAAVGAWATDFKASYRQPLSLYAQCAAHKLVMLYFFEGNAQTHMEDKRISSMLRVARQYLGAVQLIGVNREATGSHYSQGIVIEENQKWSGPLAVQFHNFRETEVICLDNSGTIIARGEPGRETLEEVWAHFHRNDLQRSQFAYDVYVSEIPRP